MGRVATGMSPLLISRLLHFAFEVCFPTSLAADHEQNGGSYEQAAENDAPEAVLNEVRDVHIHAEEATEGDERQEKSSEEIEPERDPVQAGGSEGLFLGALGLPELEGDAGIGIEQLGGALGFPGPVTQGTDGAVIVVNEEDMFQSPDKVP